ncbi:hypothetical protein DERF_007992 [Dermatophagoides farinae]|uniref:Uncharacterized protein n=1 Tax=Dermatophagoides farinae TaxID=6954 RepID=A0A922HZ19_DERFA|nr:hypothetical protein DERF_007992 [Dermatophagoides farinae]
MRAKLSATVTPRGDCGDLIIIISIGSMDVDDDNRVDINGAILIILPLLFLIIINDDDVDLDPSPSLPLPSLGNNVLILSPSVSVLINALVVELLFFNFFTLLLLLLDR